MDNFVVCYYSTRAAGLASAVRPRRSPARKMLANRRSIRYNVYLHDTIYVILFHFRKGGRRSFRRNGPCRYMKQTDELRPAVAPLWTRDFTIITLGSVVSMLGNAMSGFALSLLVLDYTESSLLYAIYIATFTASYYQQYDSIQDKIYSNYVASIARISDSYVIVTNPDGEIIYATDGDHLYDYKNTCLPKAVVDQVLHDGDYTGMTNLDGIYPERRYMAALPAKESCIQCHQDKKVGDVLGGISVSISAEPLFAAATERKRTTGLAFGIIGIIGMVGIGGATFQINRKKELAEAANRTKSAFLANMTHDMRTPLTGILGMTELLERETQDSRHRYLLANLRKATDSLLTVVDGIMRYSLLEADRQPTCCAPFSLRAELGACIAVLRPACASRDIRLSLVTDDTVPDRLVGDGFRLRQALGNLLGNAVKFTEKGSVTLRVTRAESQAPEGRCALSFQVIDTGRGIPTEEQERIFESFEQGSGVRDSGDQHETGVGLGLAIARNIARRFGGDLTLSSTPGMCSVFTFTALFRLAADSDGLPETPASPCPASPSPLAQPDRPAETGTSGRLVVAEDTAVTALFLSEALTQAVKNIAGMKRVRLLGV